MRTRIALSCLLLASSVSAKDLIVHERASTFTGQQPDEQTVYVAGDIIVTVSGATRTIVDLSHKTITTVDRTAQTYTVITFDDLQAQMDALRRLVEKLPPEAHARMDGLLDDGGAVTLERTGKTGTIAGFPATEYALSGGPYRGFVWSTEAVEKPEAFQKWKALDKARGGAARRLGEAMTKVRGFPLRARIEATGTDRAILITNEVLEVRDGSPPAELLEVPPGFTKQTPPVIPPPDKP